MPVRVAGPNGVKDWIVKFGADTGLLARILFSGLGLFAFSEPANADLSERTEWNRPSSVAMGDIPAELALPRVYLDGDSRADLASNDGRTTTQGWLWWLQLMTGARFDFQPSYNFALSGSSSEKVRDGAVDLRGQPPGYVVSIVDTNDRTAGWSAARTIAALADYQAKILSYGHRLIWIAGTPRGDGTPDGVRRTLSGAELADALQVRAWFLAQASVKSVHVADPWPLMLDHDSAQGRARDGILRDGLHWGPVGARLVAQALTPVFDTLLEPRARLVMSNDDLYSVANPGGSLVANPMFSGSGGMLGAGCSGDLADGWSAEAGQGMSAVFSKVTIDGDEWQQVVVSGAPLAPNAGGDPLDPTPVSLVVSADIDPLDLAQGDRFETLGAIELDPGSSGLRGVALYSSYTTAEGTVTLAAGEPTLARSQVNLDLPPEAVSGVAVVPRTVPLPEDVEAASVKIVISGVPHSPRLKDVPISATLRFRAVSAHKGG
ncbi:SGNH/GDSL hydrolase family protein [Mesorhizobium sp. LHD-90]|uniref:SGNH/GDSL hydrolase family protein n=1 Tax=Mesorhizobium sp. LHD-90 TaxID=3071414 RepID=UPI0027E007CB|nr:SGNH/GDSL hydrolase family protein [Mesorhizobium sp. LHD-90]MDQ6434521.1 SGNH/GDSL hydrolase family protein [Mesorhizobium sp. LHD-90]